jgi:hypothetical protein
VGEGRRSGDGSHCIVRHYTGGEETSVSTTAGGADGVITDADSD